MGSESPEAIAQTAIRHCFCILDGQIRARYGGPVVIRKLKSGEYRLYSRKVNPKTGHRRNLGTFSTRAAAEQHEREIQYFKRH